MEPKKLETYSVLCKLKVDETTRTVSSGFSTKLTAVYSGSEENKKFFQATPSAMFNLYCVNKELETFFEPGDEVYVTLSKKKPEGF